MKLEMFKHHRSQLRVPFDHVADEKFSLTFFEKTKLLYCILTTVLYPKKASIMALRQIIAKALLPNFERELGGSIAAQVAAVPSMVDNMLAPQAFAYNTRSSMSGAFTSTGLRQESAKIYVPIKSEGMFADKVSWH